MTFFALAFGARILSVLSALTVALLVEPAVFGLYGRLQMVSLIFMAFVFLRMERAVVTAPSLEDAFRAIRFGLFLSPGLAIATALASPFLIPDLVVSNAPPMAIYLYAAVLFGRSLILLLHSWLSRFQCQKQISLMIGLQSIVQFITQFAMLWLGVTPLLALLAGECLGAITVAIISISIKKSIIKNVFRSRFKKSFFIRWQTLPLYNLPASLMSQATVSLPLITIGRIADPITTGHIALAWRVSEAPMQLLAATATTLAVTAGIWSRGKLIASDKKNAAIFVALIVAATLTLLLISHFAGALDFNMRISNTAGYIPIVTLLTAGIALGAPHADLVTYAGSERLAFLVHAVCFGLACLIFSYATEPFQALYWFAAVIMIRSVCLWILLPFALRNKVSTKKLA